MSALLKKCKIYIQLVLAVQTLISLPCMAKATKDVGRKPCNFVPDDDLIVVPLVIEKNFIQEFHDKHASRFVQARKTLNHWMQQEEYAKNYGMEGTGFVNLPTAEQKQKFFERNYLRFISKDVEKTTNKGLQNTWESWTADDEIDSIKAVEMHEKVLIKAKKSRGRKDVSQTKTVKVGKDKLKFGIQPRLELGMMKFTLKSNFFYARAWLGVNGTQELIVEKRFKSTGTKAFVNYYIDETRILAAVDQHITGGWSFRVTHAKDVDKFDDLNSTGLSENNIGQLRFGMAF